MTETDRMRTNDLKINKNNLAANKATKSTRGISLDNDHKAIDGLTKLITQTNKNDENSNQPLKMILRNEENSNVKSLSPEKGFHIDYILPPITPNKLIKKTLVLDLDETLIHSNFESFSIPTDILLKYADPLIDILDKHRVCSIRLFREHCTLFNGLYVKELKRLNRNMKNVILLDNNPASYYLDIENGLPIKSFYDDKSDTELYKIGDVLENLSQVHDVREYLKEIISLNQVDYERSNLIFEEFKQNKIKNSKYRHQTLNTSYNENNISVFKTVNIDENNQSEYQMNTNNNNDNNNFKNGKYTNANIKPNRNGNAKNDNFNNNRNITYSIKNENIKGAGAGHIRNKSSLESEKKMLITFNNAKNSSSHRDHQNNINNNSNQMSFNNTNVSISNNTVGNQIQSNGNKANNKSNNKNTGQAFPDKREENGNNSNNNINNDNAKNQALCENLNEADIAFNNPTSKVNNNNNSNINNIKERMYEKIAEKFTKQQNQLKILHVEKIAMHRSSQKGGTSSNINNSKNLKKMKSTRNPTISPNIMVNSNSRAKLNSKRPGADSSKENSLVRNSFLNNSNTTKNSQKTEFFKLKNFNNLIRSKDHSSKQNSFQINSERAHNNNSNKTNSVTDKDNRDNSVKLYKYGFAIKNKTSSGNFFKLDKKNSEKSLKLNLNLDLNTQGDLNVKTTDMNVNNIDNNNNENQNESVNVKRNSTSIIYSSSGNLMKRPASVTNSNNRVFKYSGNYFSIRQQNSVKSSNGNSNSIRINNNNNNQNSISNNTGISNYNSNSTRSLIENRIKNNIKNAALSADEGELATPIGNINNNNNKVNSIRVNKEINNNKNNNFINYKKNQNTQETINSINKDNADDEYFYITNKENLEKIISENQTTLTNKSNMNNMNYEEEAVLSAHIKPIPMEEKLTNFKIGINESIDINNLNNLNNNLSNNLNSLITQNLYLNTNNNYNNNHNHSNKTIKGSLTTKNSSNGLIINNYFTSKKPQKGPISQNSNYISIKNDTYNRINNPNNNNVLNNSSTKIRSKKADSTPRHSFNAVDLKKAVLQDPAFNNKMNFFSKNFITNGPITVRNVSASQKINKKDLIFNNNKNSNNTDYQTNINSQGGIKIKTINDNFNNNYKNIEVKESYNNTNLKANAETTKNLLKNNSKNTIEKMDEFMKVSNPTTTARNVKNARMFMFDINNKSNHNNSANNSKDKYFAILNKKNPKESSNTFSTSSYSTSSSANRKPFNTITNNLKSQTSLDMKIIRIQSVAKGKIQTQLQDNNIWSNGVINRMTSAKN